jgi:hypothetical protein
MDVSSISGAGRSAAQTAVDFGFGGRMAEGRWRWGRQVEMPMEAIRSDNGDTILAMIVSSQNATMGVKTRERQSERR